MKYYGHYDYFAHPCLNNASQSHVASGTHSNLVAPWPVNELKDSYDTKKPDEREECVLLTCNNLKNKQFFRTVENSLTVQEGEGHGRNSSEGKENKEKRIYKINCEETNENEYVVVQMVENSIG